MRKGLDDRRTIGAWLAEMRERTGFTQEQAAERIGISRVQIARWETGTSRPSWEITERIASAYGLRSEDVRQRCGYSDTIDGLSRAAVMVARSYDRRMASLPDVKRKQLASTIDFLLSDAPA